MQVVGEVTLPLHEGFAPQGKVPASCRKQKTWRGGLIALCIFFEGTPAEFMEKEKEMGFLKGHSVQVCPLGGGAELTHFAGNRFELRCKNEPFSDFLGIDRPKG